MTMRAVIVDDEPLARQIIREYLADFPDVKVVGECKNGRQAVRIINEEKPGLVFLDIRMPGMDGFEVLEHLKSIPRIIFSTAYNDFAIKAFEVNAVDYLLKPYDRKRFAKAVRRAMDRHEVSRGDFERIVKLLQEARQTSKYPSQIFVRVGRKIIAVQTEQVLWIEAEGDYTKLHTEEGSHLSNLSLNALEGRLDPAKFVRLHRSSIVARRAVKQLKSDGEGGFVAMLQNGAQIRVSRAYATKMRELIW
jgi:two-component system LytT family response regulator